MLRIGYAICAPAHSAAALPARAPRGERIPNSVAVHGKFGARLWVKPQSQRRRRKKRVAVAQHVLTFGRAAAGPADTAALPARASWGARETEPIGRLGSTGSLSQRGLSN